ncbi:penicillin-binding transpeptidase domain-containing protein [Actinospongicola halichondriae]|uniref:peptidoglycan D,D-transpeptidase FtsI family protein n=1 Tax=Actinospongicola halichondriae TaxID=3236844 RepID=UPI003D3A1A36
MSWGPIDPSWGEGFEDFDNDPFSDEPAGSSSRRTRGTVTRMPRARVPRDRTGRRGVPLDRSVTAPRPTAPQRPQRPARPEPQVAPRSEERAPAPRRLRAVPTGPPGGGPPQRPRGPRLARPERRSLALKVVLGILLLAVVGKLVDIQVLDRDTYVAVGEDQRLRTVALEASRGRILDREGHDLALSVSRPSVFADPSQIDDPMATAQALAPVLDVDPVELADKLDGDNKFVYLGRRVDDDLVDAIVELELDGIHLLEEPARFTPSEALARSIIGKVADDQTGSTGIELLYDDVLTGTPGEVRYERARDGGTIAAAGQTRVAPVAGNDVVLTLDRSLQYEAERVLSEQVADMDAKGGMVVISKPETGEILALANITRNTDDEIITAGANRAVIDVFEPGSVNKVITIAAALEEGLVEPDTERVVPWRYQVSDHQFSDDHTHPTEPMTVTDILAKSSNVGTIMLGQELGKERIDEYLRKFGFGERTALDFTNESGGLLLPTDKWSGTSIGSIPIGQGIAVTAMQMLSAYNVIANDGVYVEPRLVEATVAADGTRTEIPVGEGRRVVSATTAEQVRAMLVEAVNDGTGKNAQVAGYSVGGKTGTARKPQDTGTYEDLGGNYHYVAAFTGMVPAEDPQLSVIVVIDEPTATIYGGGAAAPVFADLARFALSRFRIPPTAAPVADVASAPATQD